jgi:UDP-N-acetylmuramate dehydrogenase
MSDGSILSQHPAVAKVAAALGDRVSRNVPIAPLTTYRLGGPAALLMRVNDEQDVALLRDAVTGTDIPLLVIGRGSNTLVSDRGFDGLVVVLGGAFSESHMEGMSVSAGGAVSLPVLARQSAFAGMRGMEWAVGIPGSVGGAVRMNAGGHGSDTAAHLASALVVNLRGGRFGEFTPDQLELSYRSSNVVDDDLVLSATFVLQPGVVSESEAQISEIVTWRRQNQPGGRNSGSVFTNPSDESAGTLIDRAGMAGFRVGGARVSEKHANFIQVEQDATAGDVLALLRKVRRAVYERFAIWLPPEVRLVGFTDNELEDFR